LLLELIFLVGNQLLHGQTHSELELWKREDQGNCPSDHPKHRGGRTVFSVISSARKHAAALAMSDHSVRRILHDVIHFHPYKLAVVQELTERDFAARQHACEAFLETLPVDAFVFFSDEAHFYLSRSVNMQNMRYWSDNYPRELHERPLHCERVTVWCALSRVGIIVP
jgi:hypothetical protein